MRNSHLSHNFLVFIVIFLVASSKISTARSFHGLQEENNFLILSDFKDSALSIPDSAVWDATGSGSGKDEDETKDDNVSKTGQNKQDFDENEVQPNRTRIETGKTEVEIVEVKDDNDRPETEAKIANADHVGDALTEVYQSREDKTVSQTKKNLSNDNEASGAGSEVPPTRMPKFETVSQEIRWKFNKARDSLKKAKQYVQVAELVAAKKHRETKNEDEVKNIIAKTEVALVHAGEKIGLDYVHYKRSIPDDEDDYE